MLVSPSRTVAGVLDLEHAIEVISLRTIMVGLGCLAPASGIVQPYALT